VTVKVVVALAVLPALSVAVAVSVVLVVAVVPTKFVAGPEATAGQLVVAIPERASFAEQVTRMVWSTVYMPAFPLKVMVGAVLSILISTLAEAVSPARLRAEQVKVVPTVSTAMIVVSHPVVDAIPLSGSLTFQVTAMSVLFQPFVFGAGVSVKLMFGGVVSAGGPTNSSAEASAPKPVTPPAISTLPSRSNVAVCPPRGIVVYSVADQVPPAGKYTSPVSEHPSASTVPSVRRVDVKPHGRPMTMLPVVDHSLETGS